MQVTFPTGTAGERTDEDTLLSALAKLRNRRQVLHVRLPSQSATFTPKANSQWSNGTTADVSTPWTIRKVTIEVPTVTNTYFEQNGESHAPTISSYNTNAIAVTDNAAQTFATT